ncbi:hypothetical protein SAHL_11075 [Salinisphaera orenii YIM 95161]|uniref:Uncharacterized protein n=2 Tax=Salinisphaera TaxID=180541 RepID=A0A423PQS4_9GAMM|nr:hypothetical protein SAHL_11075 [Salinisphaera halophila YIM 95161]
MVGTAANATPAVTESNTDAIRAEIKERCQDEMGDYGDSMVLTCMKEDWKAAQTLFNYREEHPSVTQRCMREMRDYGFTMVETCVEQDASAQSEIDNW